MARRLEAAGHDVEIKDFLDAPPRPVGYLLRVGYQFQIRHLAWTYELTYRFWSLLPFLVGPLAGFVSILTRRRMRRWAEEFDADVVVSVYPLASQALGAMRNSGQLRVPAATFLTDFAVHPVWVHSGVDLHLAVHPASAADAARQSGGPAAAPGPMVAPRFHEPADRAAARAKLGLEADDRAVLIVAGSWGVGPIAETFDVIARSERFVPVVVCGRQDRLRQRLTARAKGVVLGWTDEMPELMAASDVLVENAGGLTAMEALAAGLPVVTYQPIAGHGRENTRLMHAAGVSRRADTADDLLAALEELSAPTLSRRRQVNAGRATLAGDAAEGVVAMADAAAMAAAGAAAAMAAAGAAAAAGPNVIALPSAARRRARLVARVAAVSAVATILPIGINTGVSIAAANGVGVAHPAKPARDVSYLAVRLDGPELEDPGVVKDLDRLHATAVVDEITAATHPDALRRLGALGVDVENGGSGHRIDLPWRRAHNDVARSGRLMRTLSGEPVRIFVPARHIDGIDLAWCRSTHTHAVVANKVLLPASGDPGPLVPRHTYVVLGVGSSPGDVRRTLDAIGGRLETERLDGAPLAMLR